MDDEHFDIILRNELAFLPEPLANIIFYYVVVLCPNCEKQIFYVLDGEESSIITCGNCFWEFAGDERLDPLPDNRELRDCPMCEECRMHTILSDGWHGRHYPYMFALRCDCGYSYHMIIRPIGREDGFGGRIIFVPMCSDCPEPNYGLPIGTVARYDEATMCSRCEAMC